jgi:hypothetical protein
MSSQLATSSGDVVQAALDAIMRRLDNIELKLEPLQPLQTRVEALEAVMTDHEQHQQELQDAVHWVKTTQGNLTTTPTPQPTRWNFPNLMAPTTPCHG